MLPSSQAKLRKNALFIDQSVFSNFTLYVISNVIGARSPGCQITGIQILQVFVIGYL